MSSTLKKSSQVIEKKTFFNSSKLAR